MLHCVIMWLQCYTYSGNDSVSVRAVLGGWRVRLQSASVPVSQFGEKLCVRGVQQQHTIASLFKRPAVRSNNNPTFDVLIGHLFFYCRYIFAGLASGSVAVLATHYWLL